MSCVHYKFSSMLTFSHVAFSDHYIKLRELRAEIMKKEKLKFRSCDLIIINPGTSEEYTDDEAFIPKNSSVLVRRIPKLLGKKIVNDHTRPSCGSGTYQQSNGSGMVSRRVKRSTGIPSSFLVEMKDPTTTGALLTKKGTYAVPIISLKAYAVKKKENPPFLPQQESCSFQEISPVPEELQCPICKEFLTDAVIIPCCGYSYCDDCIRENLLNSDGHVCPNCNKSGVSPDTLCVNKALRLAVNNYSYRMKATHSRKWHKQLNGAHDNKMTNILILPDIVSQN